MACVLYIGTSRLSKERFDCVGQIFVRPILCALWQELKYKVGKRFLHVLVSISFRKPRYTKCGVKKERLVYMSVCTSLRVRVRI